MTRLTPGADPQQCRIEGCSQPAAFELLKLKDDGSETEKFFCEKHGQEYALRGHLVISDSA